MGLEKKQKIDQRGGGGLTSIRHMRVLNAYGKNTSASVYCLFVHRESWRSKLSSLKMDQIRILHCFIILLQYMGGRTYLNYREGARHEPAGENASPNENLFMILSLNRISKPEIYKVKQVFCPSKVLV